jgi:glutamate racemase
MPSFMMDNIGYNMGTAARLLIFDSGVGGLSILQEIHQQYPDCSVFYASDNAAFPYGPKTPEMLVDRVDTVLHQLETITQADIIIVACNTASTVALPRIRERFSQPVIGVVPAIKPAAAVSHTKTIALLATPGTVNRDYTHTLINEFASDCTIVSVGSSELVELAERKLRGETITQTQLAPIVAPILENTAVDTIVLACTHFPLLKKELQQALPHISNWVDSGEAIARRVGYWIEQLELSGTLTATHTAPEHNTAIHSTSMNSTIMVTTSTNGTAYFTEENNTIHCLQSTLQNFGIHNISFVPIPI